MKHGVDERSRQQVELVRKNTDFVQNLKRVEKLECKLLVRAGHKESLYIGLLLQVDLVTDIKVML